MKDLFFNKKVCDRCGQSLDGGQIMSMYNEDVLCLNCKEKEKHFDDYALASETEYQEVKNGNYNFKGIGFSKEVK